MAEQNQVQQNPEEEKKSKKLWLLLLLLFLLAMITGVILCVRIAQFIKVDNDPYIPIGPTEPTGEVTTPTEPTTVPGPTEPTFVADPNLKVWDKNVVWDTYTDIELFRAYYENGEQVITVASENGDAVVAPGTENRYTFRLKNTGNVALDYTVTMKAFYSTNTDYIPIEVRMRDYNGNYCVGSRNSWEPVMKLNRVRDSATLGVNYYAYYTLEWQWPFEIGTTPEEIAVNDNYDTLLSNLGAEDPATLTVRIKVEATPSEDPNAMGGYIPATGDAVDPVLWVVLGAASAGILVVLIIVGKRKRKEDKDEGKTAEN